MQYHGESEEDVCATAKKEGGTKTEDYMVQAIQCIGLCYSVCDQ